LDVPYSELIAVLICVGLSVIFSGSETALNALGQSRIDKRLETLKASGLRHKFLELWSQRRNAALTVILIGNNVVNIAASALATVAFEKLFFESEYSGFAVPIAIFVTTFLILTFGEIIPKTYAQNNPEAFYVVTRPLYVFAVLITPVTWFFTKLSVTVIRRTGGRVEQVEPTVTEEDIEETIERASEQGNLDEEQERLLSSVLELDDTLVKEVMIPRTKMVGLDENASISQILATLKDAGFSRYPVYRDDLDEVIGVIHVRDLLPKVGSARARKTPFKLKEILREPFFVIGNKNIQDLLRELQEERIHLAIVVDEHGGTAGIITIEDIVEEVFGEIYDEYDEAEEGEDLIVAMGENSWELEARIPIRDLEEAIDVEFPEDDTYSTVAGFILKEVGGIPEIGEEIPMNNLILTVMDADEKQILRVGIRRNDSSKLLKETG